MPFLFHHGYRSGTCKNQTYAHILPRELKIHRERVGEQNLLVLHLLLLCTDLTEQIKCSNYLNNYVPEDSKRGRESPYKVIRTPLNSLKHRGYQV